MIVYDENENKYEGPIVATDDVKPDAIVWCRQDLCAKLFAGSG